MDRKLDDAVKVYAVMIDVIQEPVDISVPTALAGAKNSITNTPPLIRQMASEDDLYVDNEVEADSTFCDTVSGGPTSTPLEIVVWRRPCWRYHRRCVYSPADLAGDVTIGVLAPADHTKNITVGVSSRPTLLDTSEVAFSADIAEVASSADLADVASLLEVSPSV